MKNLKHVLHRVFIMTVIITTVFSLAHFPVLPVQATVGGDSDQDGIIDAQDNCPDVFNPDQADSDGDGAGDVCDETPYGPDADGDGYGMVVDNCPEVANPDQADYDGDGRGDACDDTPFGHDVDEDGLGALVDNCPDAANPDQADADWDGAGDACDETPNGHDNDQDGLPALFDNCPDVANADQADADSDGVGDVCDLMPYGHDDDGDGLPALFDNCPDAANPNQADADDDLTGDVCDSTPYGCDPDGDGIGELYDNCPNHSNPDQADLDGDGQGDVCDLDNDNDGVADPNDNCPFVANPSQTDSDHDGVGDACDTDCANPNCGRIDRSSLEVTGRCTADGALFTIRNTGEPGRGDMVAPTEWRLIQGDVVVRRGPVQLRGGETMDVLFGGSGQVTLEADQQIGHPGHSRPRETLNCAVEPTQEPTAEPTVEPTAEPTAEPTIEPTEEPTVEPTEEPTAEPTVEPTVEPTAGPTEEAGPEPTAEATQEAVQESLPPAYEISLPAFESEGGASPTPEIEVSDPALSKIGFLEAGAAGLVGERLTWVVTARNVGAVPEVNVVITDPINPNLQIESVITEPGHTYTIVGNAVQVTIPLLNPGEVVNFYVNTIGIAGNLPISNTATANTGETANATVNLPPINPNPQVSLNAPPEVFLGDNFTFTVTFDNADNNDTGYGPFIDVIVPSSGADGNDGITITGATYLGQPAITTTLTFPDDDGAGPGTTGCVDHPLAVDNNHQPLRVCGQAGDTLLVIQLPFGSFAPDQPPATVTVNAAMSGNADLGVPLNIRARAGFMYGADPLDNWCCDLVIASQPSPVGNTWTPVAPVTPILWELSKTYNGPEGETATGPNYPRSYTVTADIANSQTMTDVCITDRIPNNIVVTGVSGISPAGSVTAPVAFPYGPVNGGVITVCFPAVATGSASFDINYYVPEFDANGVSILNPLTGNDVITQNFSEGEGDWTPTDPRDPVVLNDTIGGVCTPPCEGNTTFTDKSIATQKSGAAVGGVPIRSGAVLEYTIVFQISDYFTFGDIVLTDIVSDGQRFDTTFTPTITVGDRVQTLSGNLIPWNTTNPAATCADANAAGANVIVDTSEIGNDTNPATDGSTRLVFCISEAMLDLGGADGILQGGRTQGATGGPATGTITYRTVVQDQFSDTYPSGDPSVDHGDMLRNDAVIAGTVRDNTNITVVTDPETDATGAQMNIAQGTLTKSIYAVNGSTTFATPVEVSPGDTITYRVQYTMPSTDFEDFVITDYLPLPVFRVNDPDADRTAGPAWVFQDVTNGTAPAAGFAHYGPADTFRARCAAIGGGACVLPDTGGATPTITPNTVDNSLAFFFGDFDDPGNQDTTIDILFTVTVNDDPFADRLYLTNQARSSEGSTNGGSETVDSIVQITLEEPVMQIRKGVTDTDNPNELFAPALVAPFPVNNTDLNNGNAYNSNVSGVDGQDLVTFAIVLRNVGHSGAFDLDVTDTLPAGLVIPAGGMNLTIRRGDGSALSWDPLNAAGVPLGAPGTLPENLFTDGIRIIDPLAPTGPVCQHVDATPGRNIAVITYQLAISPTVTPGQVIPNVAALTNVAGAPGGPNHLDDGSGGVAALTDDATTTITGWNVPVKSITETSEAHTGETLPDAADAAIGEIVRYRLAVQVPEGTAPNFTMRDTLSTGVSLLDVNQVRISFIADMADMSASALTPAENTGANNDAIPPTFVLPAGRISFAGNDVIFSLGDLVNNDNDATGPNAAEYVVIEFNALVGNVVGNDLGVVRANTFVVQTGPTPTTAVTSNTVNVTLVEPQMIVDKTANDAPPAGYDAGDVVTYTITVENPAGANRTAAFNVALNDAIPAGTTYVPGSVALGACAVAPTAGPAFAAGAITAAWDQLTGFPAGASCAITFQVTLNYTLAPAQVVTNTANLIWTSLPGTGTPSGPDNQTGSVTPGASGAANGERNGTTAPTTLNDYADSTTLDLTIDLPTAAKSITRTSEAHTVTANPEPVAVGEILRYRLYTSIPEGTAANVTLFDTLAGGLALIDQDEVRVSFVADNDVTEAADLAGADNDANPPTFVLPAGRITIAGQNVTFDLGTLVNNDSDAGLEYVILEFNVLVLNNAVTNLGVALDNTYDVRVNGVTRATSNIAAAVVVEPVLTVAKLPDGGDFDAGDVVTFTVTVNAPAGANRSTAFNVLLTDALDPANYALNLGSVAIVSATGGLVGVTNTSAGNTVSFTVDTFPVGGQLQITYQATLTGSVTPGQIDNTAVVTWTSLPGTGTPDGSGGNNTGSTTPGGSGAANGERNGTNPVVAPNDHTATDTGYVTVSVTPEKLIRVTSETHTTLAANGLTANVAIGEIVRYRLVSRISEGTIPNLQFVDALPAGLQFLDDGTALVAFVTNGFGVTSSTITPAGTGCTGGANPSLVLVGSEANVATLIPECPLPGAAITGGPFGSGTDPTFSLGDILDDDRDADAEYIIVEFNALVLNEAGNQNAVARQNTFAVWTAGTSRATSNTTTVTVVEPVLSVVKSAAPTTGDAGDTITFTVTVNHTAASTADAFNVDIVDAIPGGMTYVGGLTAGAGDPLPTVTNVGTTYTFSYTSIPLGAATLPYTFSFNVTLDSSVQVGQVLANTANLTWTSLPGTGTAPNGTGSNTPGGSGANNGERNGSGGVNDHMASEGENVTVVGPYETLKIIESTSEAHTSELTSPRPVAVGEILRYQLVTDIPEGTSVNVQLVDQMAVGLQMLQDATVTVQFISQNGITPVTYPALAGANTAPVTLTAGTHYTVAGTFATGELVTFNLGTLTNNDTDTTAGVGGNVEQVVVEFNVLVVNDQVNNLARVYANNYQLQVNGTLRDTSNTVNAQLVEPDLVIDKAAAPTTGDAGDVITFTITVNHTAASTADAFNVDIRDFIPAGMTYAGGLTLLDGVLPAVDTTGLPQVVFSWASIPMTVTAGLPYRFSFNVTLDNTVMPGQTITNTANMEWTSLPGSGTAPNATGSTTPGTPGQPNGERTGSNGPGAGLNNYAATDGADVTTPTPTIVKGITATSVAGTGSGQHGAPTDLTIGETVTYQMTVTLIEGSDTVIVIDNLPNVLTVVSSRVVSIGANISGSLLAVGQAGVATNANYPADGQPDRVTFNFGSVLNAPDGVTNAADQIVVEVVAVVADNAANSGTTGADLINDATLDYSAPTDLHSTTPVEVVEPFLALVKDNFPVGVVPTADAGDTLTFQVTLNHTAASTADAYNIVVTDTLPDVNMTGLTLDPATTCVGTTITDNTAPVVAFTVPALTLATNTCFIRYTVQVGSGVQPNATYTNTAGASYDSLPGGGGRTRTTTTDTATFNTGGPTIAKEIAATSESHTGEAVSPRPLAIGEILRYRLVVNLTEGTTTAVQLQDQLSQGLQMFRDASVTVRFLSDLGITPVTYGGLNGANTAPVALTEGTHYTVTGTFATGELVTFNLGTLVNNDTDTPGAASNAEQAVVEFNVIVVNDAINDMGDVYANNFVLTAGGVAPVTSNVVNAVVVEPLLTIDKAAAPATGDAGDTITFTITVNHAPTSTADAFDVVVTDVIPADMTYAGGLTAGAGDPLPTVANVGATYTFAYASIPLGAATLPYTFSFNVTLNNTVTVGQTITNTANLTWTSLPGGGTPNGSGGNTTGSTTPGASGSPTGERNGTTAPLAVNDYAAGEGEVVTVVGPYETLKEIAATSEAHTGEAASPRPVAVGEILRYRLVTDIPEGTSPNVQLVDQLTAGLQMFQDASVTVRFISNNGITPVTYPALAGANTAPVALTAGTHYTVAGTFATGELVTFNLGTLTNTDTDTTAGVGGNVEQVVVEFNVLVVNDAINDLGDVYANNYTLNVGGILRDTSNIVNAVVVEPVLTVNKTATPNYGDDNDVITFTITVTHPGGANTSTAFDAELTDVIPAGMTYQAGSLAHIAGVAPAALIDTGAPNLVVQWTTPFNAGDSSTIRLNAVIDPGATLGQTFTNTAHVTWTSLPGTGTPNGSGGNATGSTTPGASGAVNGERTGAGGVNNHAATGSAVVTVSVEVEKSIALTSEADTPGSNVAIGEVVRYRLSFALNNGTTFNAFSISDTLSTGVSILDLNEVRVSLINLTGDITAPADLMPANNDALPPTVQLPLARINVVGQNVTFDLGNLVNTDTDTDTEYVVVEFNALVEDVTGNFMGRVIANDFTVSANGGVVAVSDVVNVTLVGPEITLSKRNLTGGEPVGRGQTLLFEIALEHTAASTAAAHNIVITDSLPLTGAVFGALDPTTTCAGVTTGTAPNAITFTVPQLALGSRCIIRYTAQVSDSATHGMTYTNTAQAAYSSVSAAGMGRVLTTNASSASYQVAVAEFAAFPLGLSGSTGQPDQPGEGAPAPSAPSGGTGGGMIWTGVPACPDLCVPWIVYHTDRTGDWEIFRLDLEGGMGENPNLSHGLGEGVNDFAPSRSPNGEWIVFTSNRDGNWEIYAAPTDGDEDRVQRITFNTIAIDTDPVWGPGNYVVYESTRDGNWELYLVDMATGATERLTANAASDINPFWSPDGSRLVFQSDRSGQWQLYELDLATRAVILLSDGLGVDVDPQYSNGGGQIVFRSYRDGRANSVLYLMGARGGNVEPISDLAGDATNAAWSPDDSLIAYQSDLDGDLDIYIYEVASRQTRLLTDNAIPDYAPTWKCDTSQVLFTSDITGNPDIFRADARPIGAPPILVEEDADQLTHTDSDDIYPQNSPAEENASREGRLPPQNILGEQTIFLTPDVSLTNPDLSIELGEGWEQPINGCSLASCEDWLVYHTDRTGDWEIFRLNGLAGGGGDELDLSQGVGPDYTDKAPSLSPDRDWIAFASNRDGDWEIYVAATDGAQQRRVVFNPATDTDPVWSPIGNTIVYESDRDGDWNLYLLDLLTGVETRLTDDPGSDLNPFWAPDGVRVAFQSDRDGRWQIYELDLRTGETTRLSDGAGDDFDPVYSFGGHRILFRSARDGAESVIYLMNDDGSNLTRISDPAGAASNHTWSEDDVLIAYQSDLDGDMDIYIYEVDSGVTRLVTGNAIPDYAPTWYCAAQDVVFTSDVTDDPNLFMTPALPIDESPIDVASDARQLTDSPFADLYPQNTPIEENASRLGDLP